MTNVDEALKQFAVDSATGATNGDLLDVRTRAERAGRSSAVRVGTSLAVAASVAAIVAGVVTVGSRGADRDSKQRPGATTATTSTTAPTSAVGTCPGLTPQWTITAPNDEVVQQAVAALYARVRAYSDGQFCSGDSRGTTTVFLDDKAFVASGANMLQPITVSRVLKSTCTFEVSNESRILDTDFSSCIQADRPELTVDGHVASGQVREQGSNGAGWSVHVTLDAAAKRAWAQLTTKVSGAPATPHLLVIAQGGDNLALVRADEPITDGTLSVMRTDGVSREKADLYLKLLMAPPIPAGASVEPIDRSLTSDSPSVAPDLACANLTSKSPSAASDVKSAMLNGCVVRPLDIDAIATFAPPADNRPRIGSGEAGLNWIAAHHPTGTDLVPNSTYAAFGTVTLHQPPTSNLLYESVSAWVYAWQTTPLRPPCPEPPADIRAAFDKLPPLGALEDWHFLVIPVQPAYPWVAIEPATDTCFHREPAKFTIVEQ